MNKNLYRKIFSKRLGMLIAVAETTKAQGKAPGESKASGNAFSAEIIPDALALPSPFAPLSPGALPWALVVSATAISIPRRLLKILR